MFLLIDNYDSFTYNLFHFLGELGAEIVVRRNDQIMLSLLVRAGCLVIRPPHAAAARAGEAVKILRLDGLV